MQIGRVIFGAKDRAPTSDPMFDSMMQTMVESAKLRHYRDGMTDGVILALEAVLGIPAKGAAGSAWEGEVPADLRAWIEGALERARGERAPS